MCPCGGTQPREGWKNVRVLMLGNSLSSANKMPERLGSLLGADVIAHTRGGARLAEQLNPATSLGARTAAALKGGDIDVVVLQEASTHPIRCRAAYVRSACALADAARAAGAVPVIFATWALWDGAKPLVRLGLTRGQMADALADAFAEASRRGGAPVADVLSSFMRDADPRTLYATDGVHPSERGSLLAAEAIAAAIEAMDG